MKIFKNFTRIVCMAITMLLVGNNSYAQIYASNGGTYYLCQGVATSITLNDPNEFVVGQTNWEWGSSSNTCSSTCTFSNGYTVTNINKITSCSNNNYIYATVTANTATPIQVSVAWISCV